MFAGAAVAVVVGGLFWASVWIILRPPASVVPSTAAEPAATAGLAADEIDAEPSWGDLDEASVAVASPEEPGVLASPVAADPTAEVGETVLHPAYVAADVDGPVYGPFEVASTVEEESADEAAALGAAGAQADGAVDQIAARADEIASKADELIVRADELAVKADELAAKIEGLTARMEELEAKLEAAGAVVGRPAADPSTAGRPGQASTGTRAPWIVQPVPGPGSRVAAGALSLEALARGEAPITKIHMVVDGVVVPVSLERRNDTTWRGRATTRVAAGSHTVAVTVVDGQGRTGSYRWQFDASAQAATGVTGRMGR
jgi:hypothetical protein